MIQEKMKKKKIENARYRNSEWTRRMHSEEYQKPRLGRPIGLSHRKQDWD
jgi:hypothetical protein